MKTWTWREADGEGKKGPLLYANPGEHSSATHLKDVKVERRKKRPHVRHAFARAVGQGQLFVSPVGQRGFDAPAHQPAQWRDIQRADWLVPRQGRVEEGDEDKTKVFLDPRHNHLEELRGGSQLL